jgi:uncharacterized protein (TIGR00369 family)
VSAAIPDGFEPIEPTSAFGERIGPLYLSARGQVPVLGVRVEPHHANRGGRVHGGLLSTVADIALSRAVRTQVPPGAMMWTADLHVVFLHGAAEGEWIEAIPAVDRVGRSLIHASCVLRAGERELAKALATFAVRVPGLD